MKRSVLIIALAALVSAMPLTSSAGDSGKDKLGGLRRKSNSKVEKVQKKANKKLEKVRERANKRIGKVLDGAWGSFRPQPFDEPTVINPGPVPQPEPQPEPLPAPIDNELPVTPVPKPQPAPAPRPLVDRDDEEDLPPVPIRSQLAIYGIDIEVNTVKPISLQSISPSNVSAVWTAISADPDYALLANDVRDAIKKNDFEGWATLELTGLVAAKYMNTPSAKALLQTWLLAQLGYDVRMAADQSRLYALFAADHRLLNSNHRKFMSLSSGGRNYYFYDEVPVGGAFYMHDAISPSATPLRMAITKLPDSPGGTSSNILESPSTGLKLQARAASAGLLEFYDRYPRIIDLKGNTVSQWLNYADAPTSKATASTVVEPLRRKVAGMSQLDAVNTILSFVQQAFPYAYDDQKWGGDRPFFPDETINYVECDCEDHAILFTRLVKDILGVPVALLYYPGHLAAAVEFSQPVSGDYVVIDGHRMTVCDPTYYRPAGYTMPGMDNSVAQGIRF